MNRRSFLKALGTGIAGVAGNSLIRPGKALAEKVQADGIEFFGVLVDTNRCIGCRRCEKGCAEANNLWVPDISDASVFDTVRKTSEKQWTVVNRFETNKGAVFVKKQCMHCDLPGCASACLVKAMEKTETGPVVWNTNCIGCRYCLVSCPFDIPKFAHHEAFPNLQKCIFCAERLKEGKLPGCVEACPSEALIFGAKKDILQEANRRIYQDPGKYVPHVFGQQEAGGTGWLYLSAVPFDQIGFRTDLGTTPYPEYTKAWLYSVPIILLALPPLMLGISQATKKRDHQDK